MFRKVLITAATWTWADWHMTVQLERCANSPETGHTTILQLNRLSEASKPNHTKTMPAVILLHGCTGLGKNKYQHSWKSLRQHAEILNENQYVTLIVDSHGSRKISYEKALRRSCRWPLLGFYERKGDVYGAVKFLQSKDYVNKEKIIVFGQSQGAMVVLNSLNSNNYNDQYKIAAGIAYYPHCAYPNIPDSFMLPLFYLLEEKTTSRQKNYVLTILII